MLALYFLIYYLCTVGQVIYHRRTCRLSTANILFISDKPNFCNKNRYSCLLIDNFSTILTANDSAAGSLIDNN